MNSRMSLRSSNSRASQSHVLPAFLLEILELKHEAQMQISHSIVDEHGCDGAWVRFTCITGEGNGW